MNSGETAVLGAGKVSSVGAVSKMGDTLSPALVDLSKQTMRIQRFIHSRIYHLECNMLLVRFSDAFLCVCVSGVER
jgi:hypothetical protein